MAPDRRALAEAGRKKVGVLLGTDPTIVFFVHIAPLHLHLQLEEFRKAKAQGKSPIKSNGTGAMSLTLLATF